MNKQELREAYKQKRKELTFEEAGRMSALIVAHILDFLNEHPEWKHVHIYLPIQKNKEVDTFPLYESLNEKGYTLYTSLVSGEKLLTLDISGGVKIVEDDLGIPLPTEQKVVSPKEIQLVIVPLLAVDRQGHRLGYGKGYYDRFFEELDDRVYKLGLSFFAPVDSIAAEAHDVALDACVFPEGVVEF